LLKAQFKSELKASVSEPQKLKGIERVIHSIDAKQRKSIMLILFFVLIGLAAISIIVREVTPATGINSCKSILYSAQKYGCFEQLALSSGNISVCSYLPSGEVQGCVNQTALKGAGLSACREETNSSIANECIYNMSVSVGLSSYCTQISNQSLESGCIYNAATSGYLDNGSYCSEILNTSESSDCRIIYGYDTALKQMNRTYCDVLPNAVYNSLPTSVLVGSYPKLSNLSFIEEVSFSNLTYNQLCHYSISYLSGTQANASIIPPPNATSENLSAICSSSNSTLRSSPACYFTNLIDNASLSNNPKACLAANNTNYANICILAVAYKYHNSTDCRYATDNSIKGICISNTTN
jgi:hypothetical protein